MNGSQTGDGRLAAFLRENAPTAPPAPPGLEDNIVGIMNGAGRGLGGKQGVRRGIIASAAVAAIALICIGLVRTEQPANLEGVEIEQFVETSWDGTFAGEDGLGLEFGDSWEDP